MPSSSSSSSRSASPETSSAKRKAAQDEGEDKEKRHAEEKGERAAVKSESKADDGKDTTRASNEAGPIDRAKRCPFLLRVFVGPRFHRTEDFQGGNVPSGGLQIYTWLDATLHELTQLIKDVMHDTRPKGTRFTFKIIRRDGGGRNGQPSGREIGSVVSGTEGDDDQKELRNVRFFIGDFLDVAVVHPRPAGRDVRRYRA
eukprot:m.109222 g.109222  ORF g.109222 m.109222 type:complete len:200 (-) comp19130_c3_seq2:41-640(-)